MIITCQNCSGRFRVDEAKLPAGSFTVVCPTCKTTVSSKAAGEPSETSALGVGNSPSTSHPRFQRSLPAPAFRIGSAPAEDEPAEADKGPAPEANELALSLLNLLQPAKRDQVSEVGPAWHRRRVLICTAPEYREPIAISLTKKGCEVFIAADTQQAVERMRESRLDVVILDQSFDPIDQGAAFVVREVSVLRPAQRRRIFFVSLSTSKRTLDAHAAFLQNVNAVINVNELADLPEILGRSIREFNDLYKDFNAACGVAAI